MVFESVFAEAFGAQLLRGMFSLQFVQFLVALVFAILFPVTNAAVLNFAERKVMAWRRQFLGNLLGLGYFVLKVYLLSLVFIWIRATLPRLRSDQLMQFAWLLLIPITLGNILAIGFLSLLASALQISTIPLLFSLGVLNWVGLFGFLWLVGRVTRTATHHAQAPAFRAYLRLKRISPSVDEVAVRNGQEIIY